MGGRRKGARRVDKGAETPPDRAGSGAGREYIRIVTRFELQADGKRRGLK